MSILPVISKIFEAFKQITFFIDPLLSNFQCDFGEGFGAQSEVDKRLMFGALLADLSKAFDCLSHELIIIKLNAYGFSLSALKLIHNYFSKRQQITKINQYYSTWEDILFGVTQGSILGPILFSIFISDIFLLVKDVNFASYADYNTIYQSGKTLDDVMNGLQVSAKKLLKWFSDNQMKGSADKCNLIMSTENAPELQIGDSLIKKSSREKLLGVIIDYKLTFDEHVTSSCKKANNKLRALARATPYMNIENRKLLMNLFFQCTV